MSHVSATPRYQDLRGADGRRDRMARKRKGKWGKTNRKNIKQEIAREAHSDDGETPTANSARIDDECRNGEATTPYLSSTLALVLASTTCVKCKKKGSLIQATSYKGVLTCCALCGSRCDEELNKKIDNKRSKIDKLLQMDDSPDTGSNSEGGSEIEITEDQWKTLKELGSQMGHLNLSEKIKKAWRNSWKSKRGRSMNTTGA